MIMQDFKYQDDAEQPLTWTDVVGSASVFATVALLVIAARLCI